MSTEIPSELPVMVLPDCTLFPHAILPLFIFEQRYRDMLEFALETDRMFCIGCRQPGTPEEPAEIYTESTVGMIRACVGHEDGTSHLVLQGLERVRFTETMDDRSYLRARIEPTPSLILDEPTALSRSTKVLELAHKLASSGHEGSRAIQNRLEELKEPGAVSDIIAASFVEETHLRQELLAIGEVEIRLELLIQILEVACQQIV